jgi:hypothetical protein
MKPTGVRDITVPLELVQYIIDGTNLYHRLLVESLHHGATIGEVVEIVSDLMCYTRETVRSQLLLAKWTSNLPGADKVSRESYGRLFNPINPVAPEVIKKELDLQKTINDIAIQRSQLGKDKDKEDRRYNHHRHGGGARQQQQQHHQPSHHRGARSGARSGRGSHSSSSGNGAPAAAAPAGQQ